MNGRGKQAAFAIWSLCITFFLPSQPMWETLEEIYDALPQHTQEEFKAGLVMAIAALPPRPDSLEQMELFLRVASQIECHEAAAATAASFGQDGYGALGMREEFNNRVGNTYALALGILVSQAISYPSARAAIATMVESPLYKDAYGPALNKRLPDFISS